MEACKGEGGEGGRWCAGVGRTNDARARVCVRVAMGVASVTRGRQGGAAALNGN